MNYVRIAKPEFRGGTRPGSGRKLKKEKWIKASIQIPPVIWEEVERIAREEGRSRSEIAQEMIRRGLACRREKLAEEGGFKEGDTERGGG